MSGPNEIFIAVLQDIENKNVLSLKKLAEDLNLSENKVKPIVDIYLKYKFIDYSDNNQTYYITNIGKDYLKIKS
jgi:RIO-like serine/threonine protein kinase